MTDERPTVAFVGLGTMGGAMANTALASGLRVVVWNRDPSVAGPFAGRGAQVASTVADAAERADVVVTMVTNADAVRAVAEEQGLVAALRPGAVWAQMSTIGAAATEKLRSLMADRRPDAFFVDAPVSGSRVPAEQGTLVVFASGPDDARPIVAPVFDALGQRTLWLGKAGNGSRMKLVNNVLLAFTAEGVGNALALARRLGLETASVVAAFEGSPLVSPWESAKFRRLEHDEYSAEFALALALKDVHLALSEAGSERFSVLAALAEEWSSLVDDGLGGEDVTVVTRALGG